MTEFEEMKTAEEEYNKFVKDQSVVSGILKERIEDEKRQLEEQQYNEFEIIKELKKLTEFQNNMILELLNKLMIERNKE